MELHPYFQQPELFDFVRGQGSIGYCPIGSRDEPQRDRTAEQLDLPMAVGNSTPILYVQDATGTPFVKKETGAVSFHHLLRFKDL